MLLILQLALQTIKCNHLHHEEYDEYNGYVDSDLYELNVDVIKKLELLIANLEGK